MIWGCISTEYLVPSTQKNALLVTETFPGERGENILYISLFVDIFRSFLSTEIKVGLQGLASIADDFMLDRHAGCIERNRLA